MRRHSLCLIACTLLLILSAAPGGANQIAPMFPLEPPDTSSPRATIESFLYYSGVFHDAMDADPKDPYVVHEARERAERCFDLSAVAPTIRGDVALESVLRLREILDRIPLPDMENIPGNVEVRTLDIPLWRIPHTEITMARVRDGERLGAYLFTPETVDMLDEFYEEVRTMPYKDGAAHGIYEEYIYSAGWLVPDGLIAAMPDWMRRGYLGQAVWQWTGLLLTLVFNVLLLWPMLNRHRTWRTRATEHSWRFGRLAFPLAAMGLCLLDEHILNTQINITGRVLTVTIMCLEAALTVFAAWAILVACNVVTNGVIATRKIKEEAINADVIRLVGRLIALGLVFALFYRVGGYFGLPVTAVFASAGIAGVAVALAARETLANFFGGVSIFLDRPFRAGDYIVLDSGERGEVRAVGMRSTRLLTRDDVMITIPNSVITNVKIVNQSAPEPHFRVPIKVGVAYGADLDAVEAVLMAAAGANPLVRRDPEPRVRLRSFGDSAINYELLVWVLRPHDRGRIVHELCRAIYRRFGEAGIEIPFSQLEVHLRREE
jgi:MscS family membrane protein